MKDSGSLIERSLMRQDPYLFLIAATAVVAGVFFRFWDLGGAPLAVDEYFLGTATLNTSVHGLPEFACGGYYTRGLLLQYLTVPLLRIGAPLEFAVRFWPAVASVMSIAAVWKIASVAGGHRTALIAVILMSLSLWEVEFGRFGRMYAPYQAAFLWYIYFQIQHLVKVREIARWAYLGISAITILIYEGAALLIVFNFLPLVWPGKRWTIAHLLVSVGLLALAVDYFSGDSRYPETPVDESTLEITPAEEIISEATSLDYPGPLPYLPEDLLLIAATGVCLFGLTVWIFRRNLRCNHPSAIYWSGVLLCFCTGLIAFGIALLLAGRLTDLPPPIRDTDNGSKSILAWLAALSIIWIVIIFISFLMVPTDLPSATKGTLSIVFNFPDVYHKVAATWMQAIPVTTVLLVTMALITLRLTITWQKDKRPAGRICGYLIAASILLILLVALLPQPYETTRYTYFLYPLLLIVASVAIVMSGQAIARSANPATGLFATIALMVPLFTFAEDFRLSHLLRINEQEIRYRSEYPLALADHYYLRWDFRGAAFFVNENLAPNDAVIVFDQPFPHYLDRTSGIFIREGSSNHDLVAACGDERDLWSNVPLLDQPGEVQELISNTDGRVWLLLRSDRYLFRDPLEISLVTQYGLKPEFVSPDGYLAVFAIRRAP